MIIDGGDCEVGIESTVIKVEDDRVIITRPGYIMKEDLESILPDSVQVEYATKISEITPGNMFKHYSPGAKVRIFDSIEQIPLLVKASVPFKGRGVRGGLSHFAPEGFNSSQFGPEAKILILATTERIEEYQSQLAPYTDKITVWNR